MANWINWLSFASNDVNVSKNSISFLSLSFVTNETDFVAMIFTKMEISIYVLFSKILIIEIDNECQDMNLYIPKYARNMSEDSKST